GAGLRGGGGRAAGGRGGAAGKRRRGAPAPAPPPPPSPRATPPAVPPAAPMPGVADNSIRAGTPGAGPGSTLRVGVVGESLHATVMSATMEQPTSEPRHITGQPFEDEWTGAPEV